MATQADVRRIALALPGAREIKGHFAFAVLVKEKEKGFAWVWMERLSPKKARVANPGVLAVRVASLADKDLLIVNEPDKYFTEPHYDGFPAVLVRLAVVKVADLRPLLKDALHTLSPKKTVPHDAARKRTATSKSKSPKARKPAR